MIVPDSLVGQLAFLLALIVASVGVVAVGVWIARRRPLAQDERDTKDGVWIERPPVAIDPRPLPESPPTVAKDNAHRGEVWLALGTLPVNARQLALVIAKLPVGTMFVGIEPDPVNGEGAMKAGFTHWAFAGAHAEKYPNGPRLWVSWSDDNTPVVSWPLACE